VNWTSSTGTGSIIKTHISGWKIIVYFTDGIQVVSPRSEALITYCTEEDWGPGGPSIQFFLNKDLNTSSGVNIPVDVLLEYIRLCTKEDDALTASLVAGNRLDLLLERS